MSGNIEKTRDWTLIKRECEALKDDTFVVWDVDGTLITYVEPSFNVHNLHAGCQAAVVEELTRRYRPAEECDRYREILVEDQCYRAWISMPFEWTHPDVPATIRSLQDSGVTNLGLTLLKVRLYTGEDLVRWRIEHLKSLGIDLGFSFPDLGDMVLDGALAKCDRQPSDVYVAPVFSNGVICSHHLPKGPCLEAFFEKISFWPKKILFVDDQFNNLISVGEMARRHKIAYRGIHYTEYEDIYTNEIPPHWDESVARQKWSYFFENGRWPTSG